MLLVSFYVNLSCNLVHKLTEVRYVFTTKLYLVVVIIFLTLIVQTLMQFQKGLYDITGVNHGVLKLIQLLTCPSKIPNSLTQIKPSVIKELQICLESMEDRRSYSFKVTNEQLSSLNVEDSVFATDLVDEIPSAFQIECPLCLQILKKPFQVQCCGKNICSKCIKRIQEENCPCPCCKHEKLKGFDNKGLEQSLHKLQFYCAYRGKCEWTGGLTERKKHVSECKKRPFVCNYCNNFTSEYDDVIKNHWPVCGCYPLQCPNKCGSCLQRKAMENHIVYTCPKSILNCEFKLFGCNEQLQRRDMSSHIYQNVALHTSLQFQALNKQCLKLQEENQYIKTLLKWLVDSLGQTLHLPPSIKHNIASLTTSPPLHTIAIPENMKSCMSLSKQKAEQVVNWTGANLKGEGIYLIIPQNAIRTNDCVTVSLQACISGPFELSDDLELVSPVFLISLNYPFQSELTVIVKHFACIQKLSETEDVIFVTDSPNVVPQLEVPNYADISTCKLYPCSQPSFSSDYSQGKVQIKEYLSCFGALARKRNNGMIV